MEENEPVEEKSSLSLFKVIAWIGIGGNAVVGVVALYFLVSGITGTKFMTDIDNSAASTSFIVYSILFLLAVCVSCVAVIIGLSRMMRLEESGRNLFMIANFAWIVLTFLVLRDFGFYQLGVFSAIFTLVILYLSRQEMKQD